MTNNYIKIKNKVKLNTRLEQLKKKLLISNNTEISKRFTLYDLEQLKKKTRKSVIQNEISSISKLMSDKIICFTILNKIFNEKFIVYLNILILFI